MIHFNNQDYSRFARNIAILPMPPPILPPPSTNDTCTATCGSDGLKVLNTTTCQCVCVRGIPAICPSPSPRESTRTKKTKKSKRRKGRSHRTKSKTEKYSGCPEYTKGGKLKKPRKPWTKSRSKSNIIIPSPTTSLCPIGQVINPNTCQCDFEM